MKKTAIHFVVVSLFVCSMAGAVNALADVVGSKLRPVLEAADETDVFPVIITLADRADVHRFKDRKLSVRRSKIVKALKQKAAVGQRGLKALLKLRKAPAGKRLWLINGLAIRLPAAVIRELEGFPGIESIRLDETLSLSSMAAADAALSVDDVSVDEAAGNAVFTFTRSGTTSTTLLVDYASADGTATAGDDYTAVMGQLTFAAEVIEQTVAVPILNDTLFEGDETFTVS